ncbi:MAG: ABC transporter permease subunit [Oscillospiraceae bacterium]|nr:ABC transporter permease subunit [Oscillospiraceae bacterium]
MPKTQAAAATGAKKLTPTQKFFKDCRNQHQLILMIIPGIILVFIFSYIPMYGALMAFQEYSPAKGIWGSEWVGLKYFKMFFKNPYSGRLIKNTLLLGIYSLLWSFPAPIILALLLDQVPYLRYKKFVQTVSYFPHFISAVVIVGMVKEVCSIDGVFNMIRVLTGGEAVSFMTTPKYFRTIYIASGIWQGIGWGTIIYLAALSNVDPQLHEAATIDGASRFQRVRYITWPTIVPTTTVMLIFAVSGILGADSQKVLLMYNSATYETADIIGTYVYREGIEGGRYEYTTAIGLMMNIVSCVLLVLANQISRMLSDNSLW